MADFIVQQELNERAPSETCSVGFVGSYKSQKAPSSSLKPSLENCWRDERPIVEDTFQSKARKEKDCSRVPLTIGSLMVLEWMHHASVERGANHHVELHFVLHVDQTMNFLRRHVETDIWALVN